MTNDMDWNKVMLSLDHLADRSNKSMQEFSPDDFERHVFGAVALVFSGFADALRAGLEEQNDDG